MADEQHEPPSPKPEPSWGHFLGLGLEMVVGVLLGLGIGSWIDRKWGTHSGALIGALIGIAGGMYLLIKEAIRLNKD